MTVEVSGKLAGRLIGAMTLGLMAGAAGAQSGRVVSGAAAGLPGEMYKPTPSFDVSSIDVWADPCKDFYKFACGKYADESSNSGGTRRGQDGFYTLFNVNTQQLSGILEKAEQGGAGRTANEQKIGDYYKACMNTEEIEKRGIDSAGAAAETD